MVDLHSESMDRLFRTILNLETVEDCYRYFEDICTIKELEDMAQRLDTAILLSEGVNYQTIAGRVGVSTATIGRVSKCLKYGAGGYRRAIEGLSEADGSDAKGDQNA